MPLTGYTGSLWTRRSGTRTRPTTAPGRAVCSAWGLICATWGRKISAACLFANGVRSVEEFVAMMYTKFERLDILVNNACQTVRRPAAFYAHLVAAERTPQLGIVAFAWTYIAVTHNFYTKITFANAKYITWQLICSRNGCFPYHTRIVHKQVNSHIQHYRRQSDQYYYRQRHLRTTYPR
jgi:hypothetical protein